MIHNVVYGRNEPQFITKTGGEIFIENLDPRDIQDGEYLGRNAQNRMEADFRQFDEYKKQSTEEIELNAFCCGKKNVKYQKVFRFAEELKSGKFKPVNKDVNLLPPVG